MFFFVRVRTGAKFRYGSGMAPSQDAIVVDEALFGSPTKNVTILVLTGILGGGHTPVPQI